MTRYLSVRQRNQLILLSSLILLAIFISKWNADHRANSVTLVSKEYDSADWFVDDIVATSMDLDGKPLRTLYAKRMLHFDKTETTEIISPHLYFFRPDGPPWQLRSKTGKSFHGDALDDITKLELRTNVILWRNKSATTAPMRVTTEAIDIFPQEDKATTNLEVTFHQPGHTIKGVGMLAHFDTETVNLLHNVRGKHITPKGSNAPQKS